MPRESRSEAEASTLLAAVSAERARWAAVLSSGCAAPMRSARPAGLLAGLMAWITGVSSCAGAAGSATRRG